MGIPRDLWKIISEELEVPSFFLVRMHLKTFRVEQVYGEFLLGKIQAEGVYGRLRPSQAKSFIALHESAKKMMSGEDNEVHPELTVYITRLLIENRRRFAFALSQIDAMIDRDLEKNIRRRAGGKNIVRREF